MRRIIGAGAGAALVLVLSVALPSMASAAPTTVVVTSTDLVTGVPSPGQFVVINQSGGHGGVGTVLGPATPPLGPGSLQLTVTGTADHWSVYNYDHIGTPLSNITALGYSTYTDNGTTDPILQIEINPGNTTGTDRGVTYSTLNFEPYLQSGGVTPDAWQPWNVLSGKVWGTNLGGAPEDAPLTWSSFLATYPNATIKGGFGVNVGSGWSAMTGEADALTIGTAATAITYIFEPGTTTSLQRQHDIAASWGGEDCIQSYPCSQRWESAVQMVRVIGRSAKRPPLEEIDRGDLGEASGQWDLRLHSEGRRQEDEGEAPTSHAEHRHKGVVDRDFVSRLASLFRRSLDDRGRGAALWAFTSQYRCDDGAGRRKPVLGFSP